VKTLKLNPNLLIFGFFLLIAFLFWFLNALSKEYVTEISIPINYINFPENKLVADSKTSRIKVRITAYGYRIFNYKTTKIEPIIINLRQHKPKPINNSNNKKYYILSQTIKDEISDRIGRDLDVSIIEPDSLIFNMDEVISKKVPVRKNFEVGFKKQFMLKDNILIFPDSIKVKGVKSLLDTITGIYTLIKKFTELDGNHSFDIGLIEIPGTEFSSKSVNLNIDVEEFTEQQYELPIELVNVPEKLRIKLYPTIAKISFNIGFSRFHSIYKEQFRVIADYKEAGDYQNSRLRLKVVKSPEHVSAIRIYPKTVDYIIENND